MQGRFMSLFLSKCSRSRTGSHILRSPFGLRSTAVACTYRRSDRRPALLRTGCVFSVFTSTIALILQRCKHLSCIAAVNRSISLVCSKCLLLLERWSRMQAEMPTFWLELLPHLASSAAMRWKSLV